MSFLLSILIQPVLGADSRELSLKERLQAIPFHNGENLDLAQVLLWISQDRDRSIQDSHYMESIQSVVQIVQNYVQNESDPRKIVDALKQGIHQEAKFRYTDRVDAQGLPLNPEELFLHGLLKTKNGYCMTLSLIYLIVGERLNLPLYGVALPNHFFVRYDSPDYRVNIETTQNGAILPDRFYFERFGVSEKTLFFMKNLNKKQTLGAYFSNVGTVYYKQNRTKQAVFYLELATRINSNSLEALNNLGNMYSELKQYDKAIVQYEAALKVDPVNGPTLFNLGITYNDSGSTAKAVETYLQMVRIDPFFAPAHKNLSKLFLKEKKYYKALLHLKQLTQLEPNDLSNRLAVVDVYMKTGTPGLALADLKQLDSTLPHDVRIKERLAEAYYKSNQFDQAIEQYRYLIERRPDDFKAYIQLGWTHYQNREIDLALAWTKHALNRTETLESLKTLAQMNLGLFHLLDRKYDEAKSWYKKALSKKNSTALQGMLNDLSDAGTKFKEFHEIEFFKGWLSRMGGQIEQAVVHLKRYLDRNPNGPNAKEAQGLLLQLKGETALNGNPSQKQDAPRARVYNKEEMIEISAGYFIMGSNDKLEDERPKHKVYLNTFLIDRFEVSAAEYAAFLNEKGNRKYFARNKLGTVKFDKTYRPKPGLERFPINNISWIGAKAYCRWKGKRLPTEAEWEKAARGTDGRRHPWGNGIPDAKKARFLQQWAELKERVMVPIDSMPEGRSPYGLHHIAGNVKEWVDDWYDQEYYKEPDHSSNPEGPLGGEFKVLKGGSWRDLRGFLYSSFRNNSDPGTGFEDYGFRCAKSLVVGNVRPIRFMRKSQPPKFASP